MEKTHEDEEPQVMVYFVPRQSIFLSALTVANWNNGKNKGK